MTRLLGCCAFALLALSGRCVAQAEGAPGPSDPPVAAAEPEAAADPEPAAELPTGEPEPPTVESAVESEPPPFTTQSVWKHWKRWNLIAGEDWAVIGFGALALDYQLFDQDRELDPVVGSADDFETGEVRALRLGLVATYGTDITRRWRLTFAAAFRGFDRGFERQTSSDAWTIFDLSLTVPLYQYGWLNVGKLKGFSCMERHMSLLNMGFLERSAGNDALLTARDIGVTYNDVYLDQRLTFGIGIYNAFLERSGGFDDHNTYASGRVTALLVDPEEPGDLRLHLGVHGRYNNGRGSADEYGRPIARAASRPEVQFAPTYLNTGPFEFDWAAWYGAEIHMTYGPVWLGAEGLLTQADLTTPGLESPLFAAANAFAVWTITGEPREYNKNTGVFGRVIPHKVVTDGGIGAFHVGARVSWTDLNSGDVQGGELFRLTGAVTWQPAELVRLDLNYGWVHLDRDDETGVTHVFQTRLALAF